MSRVEAYKGRGKYIFISYAHKDKDLVLPFIEVLQRKYNVWFDEGIKYGREWDDEIATRLEGCSLFLFIISNNSLASNNCLDEIAFARDSGLNFVNILLNTYDTNIPKNFTLRYGRYQMCKLDQFTCYEDAVDSLAEKCEFFREVQKDDYDASIETHQQPTYMPADPEDFDIEDDTLVSFHGVYEHLRVPDGIRFFANLVFNQEPLMVSIYLPASLEFGAEFAFNENISLEEIYVDHKNTHYSSKDGVLYDKNKSVLIKYPESRRDKKFVIPNTVEDIFVRAFKDAHYLEEVVIPPSVDTISMFAFEGAEKIKKVTLLNPCILLLENAFTKSSIEVIEFNGTQETWEMMPSIKKAYDKKKTKVIFLR